jgi:hypothetical protein
MNRIIEIFFDVNMSLCHKGLTEHAKRRRRNVAELKPGEFILFYNKRVSAVKAFGANGVYLHTKTPDNRQFNLRAMQLLPKFMSDTTIGYDRALRAVVEAEMKSRGLWEKFAK